MGTRRSLKAQIQADTKRVFLNRNDFATVEKIRYWRDGDKESPIEYNIPIVVEQEGDNTKTWNKQESYQLRNEPIIAQKGVTLYAALEDFGQIPKRRRKIQVGTKRYEISGVSQEAGMLLIRLRTLEE